MYCICMRRLLTSIYWILSEQFMELRSYKPKTSQVSVAYVDYYNFILFKKKVISSNSELFSLQKVCFFSRPLWSVESETELQGPMRIKTSSKAFMSYEGCDEKSAPKLIQINDNRNRIKSHRPWMWCQYQTIVVLIIIIINSI